MFNEIAPNIQFIIAITLTAGALSFAFSTIALPDRAKEKLAPMLLFSGSISSIFLILSSIFAAVQYFISVSILVEISIIFLFIGMLIILIPITYLLFKLLKIQLILRY